MESAGFARMGRGRACAAGCGAAALMVLLSAPLLAQEAEKPAPKLADLAFMVGAWQSADLEEHWSAAANGAMMGMSRLDKGKLYEFMLIEQAGDGTIMLRLAHFKPGLKPDAREIAFRLRRADGKQAVFELPENSFPARITYSASAKDELLVRLEDNAGKRKLDFSLTRIGESK